MNILWCLIRIYLFFVCSVFLRFHSHSLSFVLLTFMVMFFFRRFFYIFFSVNLSLFILLLFPFGYFCFPLIHFFVLFWFANFQVWFCLLLLVIGVYKRNGNFLLLHSLRNGTSSFPLCWGDFVSIFVCHFWFVTDFIYKSLAEH